MSEPITITLPAIDETLIAAIETTTTETLATETLAFEALRKQYSKFARQNGFIKIAYYEARTVNWEVQEEEFYREAVLFDGLPDSSVPGRKVRALLCDDNFTRGREDQNSGSLAGSRLYLTERGKWLQITRVGSWSAWQGAPDRWGCGVSVAPDYNDRHAIDLPDLELNGSIIELTDVEVAQQYYLDEVIAELGKSLSTLATKLPARMNRLTRRLALTAELLTALGQSKQ